MNENVYVVVYGTSKREKQEIVGVFKTEEKAQSYVDGKIIEWLKNQEVFDPDHKFSGEVRYGYEYDDKYYVMLDVRDSYYAYFDILVYDYN